MKDITERQKFEVEFRNNTKLWQITLDAISESIFLIDLNHKILQCNRATLNILGKSNYKEIIGHSCWELVHGTSEPVEWCPVKRMRESGQREIAIEKVNGRWAEISATPVFDDKGDLTGTVHVITDITSRKRIEDASRESEQQYRTILNSLNDPMHVVDKDLKIIFQNPAMVKWLDKLNVDSDLIGKNIFEKFSFLDYDKIYNEYSKIFRTGETLVTREINELFNRKVFTETLKIPIKSEGKVEQVITIIRDITEQKEAEQKLKDSEEKYRYLIENALEGVWVIDSKADTILVNPSMANILGYSVEEMIGKSIFSFMDENEVKITKLNLERRKKGLSEERDAQFTHRRGNKVYLRIRATPIFDSEGNYEGTYAFLADITQNMLAEQKLKESEERFRTLFEIAPASISVLDLDGNIILSNQQFCNLHGVKNPELLEGRKILEFIAEKDWSKLKEAIKKSLEGLPRGLNQYAMLKDNGTEFLAEAISSGIKNKKGEIIGLIGVAQDITERNIGEQKLKESEEKYSHLFLSSPYSIIIANMNGKVIDCNFLEDKITGYLKEEIIGKSMLDIPMFPKEYLPVVMKDFKTLLKGRIPKPNEVQIRKKNGTLVWVQPTASIFKIEGESYIQIIMQEISERKISEEMLKESEEKFRTIAEQSFMGIIILQDGVFKYFNKQAAKMNGYSMKEIQNWKPYEFQKLIYPDDREFVMEQARKKQLGDPDVVTNYQYRVVKKNGEVIWVDNYSKTISYKGKPADFVMTIDINDKIKAEHRLKDSEEKYRLISENTDDLIVVYSEHGIVEYFNAETHSRVLGYSPEQLIDKTFRDALVHEDDREIAKIKSRERIKKGSYYYQFRLKHQNGKYFWFEVLGKTFTDSYNNKKILCISRNIEEKKSAENKIRESEENFRTIAEQAFMGTLIIQNDQVVYMNNALLQIFDFSQEEVNYWKKDDLLKLIHPEDLQYLREHRQRIRDGESDIKPYYSYRVFTKYGKIKWIDQFSRPIIYRGKPAEIVTIMDITEKKKAEQELVKLNSLKSELLRRTSHELKTPLVSIKGFSDLLLTVHKEKLDDYVLATIHEIRLGCERLESLIQDILRTSELESESVELKKSEEDLSFLIKLCVKELQGLIRLRNHEINLDIHDKLITSFEPDQIHLVISNLLNNAIKYTPPNGKIEVKSAITDNSILISIHDNGIGITNEEKKRLFSQFGKIERFGQGLDIISDGSGLGLYIAKKIVELHGGKIGVKSKGRNKGSIFYFTLPVTNEK